MSSDRQQRYRTFAREQSDIPVFHTPEWLDIVCGQNGWDVSLYEPGQIIQGILPYQLSKYFTRPVIRQPLLTPYLGPHIFYPNDACTDRAKSKFYRRACKELIEQLPTTDFCRIICMHHIVDPLPFIWNGYQSQYSCTYIIPKSEPKIVWENIYPETRKKIRSSQEIITIKEDQNIDLFYERHQALNKQKGIQTNYNLKQLQQIFELLHTKESFKILSAFDVHNKWSSSILTIADHNMKYYLLGARDTSKKDNSMYALWWASIQEHINQKAFNFEGSIHPDIARVYQSFGAEQTNIYNLLKKNSIFSR